MAGPSSLGVEEFRVLRATIRSRGTQRLLVALLTFVAWGALVLLPGVGVGRPSAALVPLIVLAAGFEAVFAAHVGVERIGRYIQLRYESAENGAPQWERTAMALGPEPRAALSTDPLFILLFAAAAVVNVGRPLLVLVDRAEIVGTTDMSAWLEWLVLFGMHLVFAGRLLRARQIARTQRATDLELLSRVLGGRADA